MPSFTLALLIDEPIMHSLACTCVICTKASCTVCANPLFWLVNFMRPWALTRENTVHMYTAAVGSNVGIHVPLGPYDDRVTFASSLQAVMLRYTASSSPR